MSKKKIRALIKKQLPFKMIGGRMFVEREELEKLLHNDERDSIQLS
jgi:superfamily I DNA/RNA helicase